MSYTIEYFNPAVRAKLDDWPPGLRARYRALVVRMLDYGPNLGMPHTRSMGDGLYEIRIKATEGNGRVLYCALFGQRILILHGFIKKSGKAPSRELDLARQRMKKVLQVQRHE